MEDDGFMLNNIISSLKTKTKSTVIKKSDLKREKYAQKSKNKRKGTTPTTTRNSINFQKEGAFESTTFSTTERKKSSKPTTKITSLNQQTGNNKKGHEKSLIQYKTAIMATADNKTKSFQQSNTKLSKNNQNLSSKPISIQPKGSRTVQKSPAHKINLNTHKVNRRQARDGTIDVKNYKEKMTEIKEIMPQKASTSIQRMDTAPVVDIGLHKGLTESLTSNKIERLTRIQTQSYNSVVEGKDCIIKAATGSGKTLAYLIPLIQRALSNKFITKRQEGTTILVVCPTRQLCVQAQNQALRCLKRSPFLVPGCLVGGQQTNHEKSRIRKGIPLLFSTPGRLLYHLKNTTCFKLQSLKAVVFEQADRTLDMGFHNTVEDIIESLQGRSEFRKAQKILVSAHFNERVENLIQNLDIAAAKYIGFTKAVETQQIIMQNNALKSAKDSAKMQVQRQGQQSGNNDENFEQQMHYDGQIHIHEQEINTSSNLKQQYVLISEQEKIPFMLAYISVLSQSKIMIFVSTISEVEFLDYLLCNMVYRNSNGQMTDQHIENRNIYKIHGDLDQKLRKNTYFAFRK